MKKFENKATPVTIKRKLDFREAALRKQEQNLVHKLLRQKI